MKQLLRHTLMAAGCAAMMTAAVSCGEGRTGWSIDGTVNGAPNSTLYIEEPSGAAWIIVDSVHTDGNGRFDYRAVRPYGKGQAIYRLRLGTRSVYFPIEGAEALTLTTEGDSLGGTHRLSGTTAADGFNTIDSLVSDAVTRLGASGVANDAALIDAIGNIILADTTCIVSYYAIKHPVVDRPLFVFDNARKTGILGAAATRYSTMRPHDPRGKELALMHQNARKALRGVTQSTFMAELTDRPALDFVRVDNEGKTQDLNAVLDRGGVTVLNLTRYDDPASAANTVALGQVYERFKDRGLVIYQVSFDPNEANWRQTAATLPWITVYNRPNDSADILVKYNANPIDGGPVSFVFNRNGELVSRVSEPSKLGDTVASMF